jgi:hypothetical protein
MFGKIVIALQDIAVALQSIDRAVHLIYREGLKQVVPYRCAACYQKAKCTQCGVSTSEARSAAD